MKDSRIKRTLKRLGVVAIAFVIMTASVFSGFARAQEVKVDAVLTVDEVVVNLAESRLFKDVENSHWGIEAIKWGVEEGLVKGYEDGTFRPDIQVSEAEFATIVARYVENTDKEKLKIAGHNHWSDNIYEELKKWEIPLKGYNDNKARDTGLSRGEVARVVAAKYGLNLNERQAVYFMYENDLTYGMIPGEMTFNSYNVDAALNRVMAVEFMRKLNSQGYVKFMGKEIPADNKEMVGIKDVHPSNVVITDDMFDKLAKDKGIENPPKSENVDELWESLDKSGGIVSESQLTPAIIQKIKDLGPMCRMFPEGTIVGGWTTIDDDLFEKYKTSIEEYFKNTKEVDAKSVVVCKDLYWETKPGQSANRQYFRVIVNGREDWGVEVGFTGKEHKVFFASRVESNIFD
ncbi:MAG: S-layer homology domain-containing protein [Tepidanaerobacter acetatoxydans]|uniref:S-layer homology domain-containing protein n=1 Tax=Tepidanaerobacter TaxID=499228 RepID=UPI000B13C825|nr:MULTISPECIES: S-layer homology domain-containing protein [Tepidanaerobacter]NLU09959.1 S-layer homology domain-containing protein [Tepidanaerobacter acetatoxydans]